MTRSTPTRTFLTMVNNVIEVVNHVIADSLARSTIDRILARGLPVALQTIKA